MVDPLTRWQRRLSLALVALVASVGIATAGLAAGGVTPQQVIATFEQNFGVHSGQRRNHIKGSCASGSFVANANARQYSRSPIFSGQPVPVVARFSLAGGNPKAPDTARSPRGLGLQFKPRGAGVVNMALINTPVFGAATPESFHGNLIATRPDPATGKPDPDRVKAFRASHPDTKPQAAFLAANNPVASYTSSSYYSLHAFRFLNSANRSQLVRWAFVPQDGERRLSDEELKAAPANFLEQRLLERTQQGPVKWDLVLTLGKPGDVDNDPSVAWPEDRKTVTVGTLTLSGASPQKGGACEAVAFDPLVLGDGIVATNDPVLQFRSGSYAISYDRRNRGV
ncbi:catalase family peroxidase [Vulcanococcus limneticus]|uniref:catalase family peroxidase n=1 Tax=Vulcanococcus limneticus TaxID=2170428 RepID=UPI00398BDF3B